MRELRFALIGCGALGRIHLQCVAQIPGARFVAYADVNEAAAHSCLQSFGGEYATTEAARLFNDKTIDAVYICTRHDSHAPLAIAAARAGKHILIEKPLALNFEDCEAIAHEVKAAGVRMMPAFKMRYYPLVRKAKAFIPRPQVLVGQMMDERWADDHWAQDPAQGGANVASQGCHTADILRYLAGEEPRVLWATGGSLTHPGHPCLDQCVASIQFENGHVASWVQGDAGLGDFTGKFFFQLFGDGKSVQLYDRLKKATFHDGAETWTEERSEEEGFLLENREFVSALLNNREPEIVALDAIQATRMVLAAERAIRSGEVQSLSFHRASPQLIA
jgi:predicted dehydrogenase